MSNDPRIVSAFSHFLVVQVPRTRELRGRSYLDTRPGAGCRGKHEFVRMGDLGLHFNKGQQARGPAAEAVAKVLIGTLL